MCYVNVIIMKNNKWNIQFGHNLDFNNISIRYFCGIVTRRYNFSMGVMNIREMDGHTGDVVRFAESLIAILRVGQIC